MSAVVRYCGLAVDQRADLGQLGISRDFEPPPLIIRQMELQAVELVRRHLVDDLEERRLAEEVPALVDQEPAPAEPRGESLMSTIGTLLRAGVDR